MHAMSEQCSKAGGAMILPRYMEKGEQNMEASCVQHSNDAKSKKSLRTALATKVTLMLEPERGRSSSGPFDRSENVRRYFVK